ncbi:hypothetical protein BH23ACT9_BH23ACT9_32750 [soil metagenome]
MGEYWEAGGAGQQVAKERHGCVTAWLWVVIVANAGSAFLYLLAGETVQRGLGGGVSPGLILLLGVLSVANIVFAVMLLQWKKVAFLGFVGTSLVGAAINVMLGIAVGQTLIGLLGVGILYAVLQMAKNGRSAWAQLE